MSYFEANDNDNDFDFMLIKYGNYYLNELTHYGSLKTEQMMKLVSMSQELTTMEKNIIDNYYNYYVMSFMKDTTSPNVYCVQKILYSFTNIIFHMIELFMSNETNTDEYKFKSVYLIGCIENYINKIIVPIEIKLEHIVKTNNSFELDYPITSFKKFIGANKTKFTSKKTLEKIMVVIDLFG